MHDEAVDYTALVLFNWVIWCEIDPLLREDSRFKYYMPMWVAECEACGRWVELTRIEIERLIKYETSSND